MKTMQFLEFTIIQVLKNMGQYNNLVEVLLVFYLIKLSKFHCCFSIILRKGKTFYKLVLVYRPRIDYNLVLESGIESSPKQFLKNRFSVRTFVSRGGLRR